MSEQPNPAEPSATEVPAEPNVEQPKPTETVDFWKQKAREQEKRAKDNADAAKRLTEIEDSQKTEAQRTAERLSQADAEVASVPSKVAESLRTHLVALHDIDQDDADLFLTGSDPELLLKQVTRLLAQQGERSDMRKKNGNHVPREGSTSTASPDESREFVGKLFGGD